MSYPHQQSVVSSSSIPGTGAMITSSGAASTSTGISIDPSSVLISALATTMGVLGGSSGGTGSSWNIDSVLSTTGSTIGIGDGQQYWDETIQKSDIYASLQNIEPTQYDTHIHVIMKAMKFIFANMSKGRDVSDFYILMLKLVNIQHYDIRKMVYIYLIQYANYNATTREMSLLSINSFQKGLCDIDPMIRALALRVLTSIKLNDIISIQVLAITNHCKTDSSIHVRQCAIIAIAKLVSRLTPTTIPSSTSALSVSASALQNENDAQRQVLFELIQHVLEHETSTALLGSAIIAFYEYCTHPAFSAMITSNNNNQQQQHMLHLSLHVFHSCYSKLCHLLCDFSEYVQVILIGDLLVRYCRLYFQQPYYHKENGSAYQIDMQRRVTRPRAFHHHTIYRNRELASQPNPVAKIHPMNGSLLTAVGKAGPNNLSSDEQKLILPPHPRGQSIANTRPIAATTVKRRVVNKGFYSDEEDESTEEEVIVSNKTNNVNSTESAIGFTDNLKQNHNQQSKLTESTDNSKLNSNEFEIEEQDIHVDHRLLLKSAMPLLKSRNSGVVLAVCTLQYYCGVASIPIRKQIGQSLVRIYKSNNKTSIEIQYVVLSSIRQLVQDCPTAFIPYIQDFFILPNIDPNYTRMIKLDILTYLAIDPPSILAVLNELRTYLRQINYFSDKNDNNINSIDDMHFVSATIRAVGRIVENARIVYDRHIELLLSLEEQQDINSKQQILQQYRTEANTIALNCLYGLLTLSRAAESNSSTMIATITCETILVLQRILQVVNCDTSDSNRRLIDPNQVRDQAFHRILLLLVNTLNCVANDKEGEGLEEDDQSDDEEDIADVDARQKLEQFTCILSPIATASAIWLTGEYMVTTYNIATNSDADEKISSGKFADTRKRSKLCLELLRLIARSFIALEPLEKEQAIHFASKIVLSLHSAILNGSDAAVSNMAPLCELILALGRTDSIPDIRDRARFESSLIHYTVGLRYDTDGIHADEHPSIHNKLLSVTDTKRILLGTKPAVTYLPISSDDYDSDLFAGTDKAASSTKDAIECSFRFGTLSSLVGHKARSTYIPLPPWAVKNSDSLLRLPAVNGNKSAFYRSSSSSEDEDSDSSSGSEQSDVEDSNDDTDSDTDSESDEDDDSKPKPASVPSTQLHRLDMIDDDESSSSDDDSGSADDSESSVTELFPNVSELTNRKSDSLIPTNPPTKSSAIDDMRGLVFDTSNVSIVSSSDTSNSGKNQNMGGWMTLVRSDKTGGLLVECRYLRNRMKLVEAQRLGLVPPEKPSIVCLQMRLSNKKVTHSGSNNASIRHIRLVQHSSSAQRSTSTIVPRRVVISPSEISELGPEQSVLCTIGIEFTNISDREGSCVAKVDMKYGSINSTVTIDMRPSLGDLLIPHSRSISTTDFDTTVRRMQGFSRVESTFTASNLNMTRFDISARILSSSALTEVSNDVDGSAGVMRFMALLPASLDPIYVVVSFPTTQSSIAANGTLTVCCDHALVANSFMQILKRSITE